MQHVNKVISCVNQNQVFKTSLCGNTVIKWFKKYRNMKFLGQIYLIYQHLSTNFTSYQKYFTIFTCARPFNVSFLYEEPPPSRSNPSGAYSWHSSCIHISASAWQPGEMHNATAFALLYLLQLGRSFGFSDVLLRFVLTALTAVVLKWLNNWGFPKFFWLG